MHSKTLLKLMGGAFAFLLTVAAALFFRTYPLQSGLFVSDKAMRRMAETMVRAQMRKQIELHALADVPQISTDTRAKLVEQKLEELIERDRSAFNETISNTATGLAGQRKAFFSYRYLSEADPYYYLNLTQNVLATGHLGKRIAGGRFFNPLRHAPFGNPDAVNLHPYVGAAVYHFLHLFKPDLSLMKAVGFTPLFLTVLAAIIFFGLWPLLGVPLFPFWLGAQIFFLAPIVIQRSTLGWYDTDPYNLIFPMLILTTLLAVFKKPQWILPLALMGGFLTGFYALWWQGWAFILCLVSFAAFVIGIGLTVRGTGRERFSVLTYATVYTGTALLFAALFITPQGLWDALINDLLYSSRVQGGSSEIWPNLLVMVGETNQESFKKWIYLTSHFGVAFFALVGFIVPLLRRRKSLPWLAVALIAVPLFFFSFTAERFAILAVLPLALLAVYGIKETLIFAKEAAAFLSWAPAMGQKSMQFFAVVIVLLAILPRSLIGAHVSGFQSHFIMNDAWYGVFEDLKNTAPRDSIVHSWWPPGYFINAISGLRSVADGGSHHFHENFWMAKALMSRDERQSCGLFRMLTAGGNRAMEFLEEHGIHGDQAVDLILKVVAVNRQKASAFLPEAWSAQDKEEFLNDTHGHGVLPAAYVLMYQDMMTQNLALQVVDNWSFGKAKIIFKTGEKKNFWESLTSRGAVDYTRKMLQVTGQGLPYEEPVGVVTRQGNKVVFKNGLVFDPSTGRAFLRTGNNLAEVRTWVKQGDTWNISELSKERTPLTAIIFPDGDSFLAVAAHRDLIPTTLYQLTYLDGRDRPLFHVVSQHGSVKNSDYVAAYQIDWSKLQD